MFHIRRLVCIAGLLALRGAFAAESMQGCAATEGVQTLVCGDADLVGNEADLADAFASARRKAGSGVATLEAEQDAWLASRERCMAGPLSWECVRDRTMRRTAALQARFRLVEASGRATFVCEHGARDTLQLEFFPTGPLTETAIAQRGGSDVLLWRAPSASGARYVGPSTEVWLSHGDALVRWGKGAAQTECRRAQ